MTENTDFAATAATNVMPQETTLAQEQPPNLFYPIFIGLALSTLTLNFLNLQYILPAMGLLFLWLGFRRLRQVNGWFKACWIVTILRTVAFLFILIVNATIWNNSLYQLPVFQGLGVFQLVVPILTLFCLWQAFHCLQRQAGKPPQAAAVGLLLLWYLILCALAYVQYQGLILSTIFIIAYIYCLWKLFHLCSECSLLLSQAEPAPVRFSDAVLSGCLGIGLLLGILSGYLFFNQYPMDWTALPPAEQTDQRQQRAALQELGFPADVLEDLTAEDLAACQSAVTVQKYIDSYLVYQKETAHADLRTTIIAVQLSDAENHWKVFHHFRWIEKPQFYGTDAIQLWPADSQHSEYWHIPDKFSGQLLYENQGQTYTAPYYRLERAVYQQNNLFGSYTSNDIFADFSFPKDGQYYRGYVAYDAYSLANELLLSSWMNYIHQRNWMQYPVMTAKDFVMYASIFASDKIFSKTARNVLQVHCTAMIETIPKRNSPSASKTVVPAMS